MPTQIYSKVISDDNDDFKTKSTSTMSAEIPATAKLGIETPKMGPVKTFFAIIKAYCAINILLLPYSFAKGGYILSPCAMAVAVFFEALCAARLSTVAKQFGIYSYPLIMERALGRKGMIFARVVLALSHF